MESHEHRRSQLTVASLGLSVPTNAQRREIKDTVIR
jgi:hypothetical protein